MLSGDPAADMRAVAGEARRGADHTAAATRLTHMLSLELQTIHRFLQLRRRQIFSFLALLH